MSKKLSSEYIIQKFKNIHGDKYDYSLVDYVSINKKVKIDILYNNLLCL